MMWLSIVTLAAFVHSNHAFGVTSSSSQHFVISLQHPKRQRISNNHVSLQMIRGDNDEKEQAMEALQSLGDFHQGSWTGTSTSFTVSDDTAAGIIQKKISEEYQLDVRLVQGGSDLAISETFSWPKDPQHKQSAAASRTLPLRDSNVDVDAVDASYSADSSLPDLPSAMTGTDKFIQFAVEQCIAVSDDERVRLFALYQDKLVRVVVCEEKRLPEQSNDDVSSSSSSVTDKLSASDLMEMQEDVDRLVDKIVGQVKGNTVDPKSSSKNGAATTTPSSSANPMDRLQASLTNSGSATSPSSNPQQRQGGGGNNDKDDRGPPLYRHTMSLLDLTSGVWLGDAIIRDFPSVASSKEKAGGKGFGSSSSSTSPSSSIESEETAAFGSWEVGVQKVARQWMWDFGDEIRQVNDAGKAMGADMEPALAKSLAGAVCGKESFSRRIPKEERMVYIDWNDGNGGDHVGFLLGSVSVQVPRFLNFDGSPSGGKRNKPFYTELCVYQSESEPQASTDSFSNLSSTDLSSDASTMELPEICCSRICRIYNDQGRFKQGLTSFYNLKRFGTEMDDDDDT